MYCSKCGSMLPEGSPICPECGTEQSAAPEILDDSYFAGPNGVVKASGSYCGVKPEPGSDAYFADTQPDTDAYVPSAQSEPDANAYFAGAQSETDAYAQQGSIPQSFGVADIASPATYYNKLNEGFHSGGELYTPDFQNIVMLSHRNDNLIQADNLTEPAAGRNAIAQVIVVMLIGIIMVLYMLGPIRNMPDSGEPGKPFADFGRMLSNYLTDADLFEGQSLMTMLVKQYDPMVRMEKIWTTDAYGDFLIDETGKTHWEGEYVPLPEGLNFYEDDALSTLTYDNGIIHVDDKLWGKKYEELKNYFYTPELYSPLTLPGQYERSEGIIYCSLLRVYYPDGVRSYNLFFEDDRLVAVRMTDITMRFKIPDEVFDLLENLYGTAPYKRMNIYSTMDVKIDPTESGYTDCRWVYPVGEREGIYSLYIEIIDGTCYFIHQITSPDYYLEYNPLFFSQEDYGPGIIIYPGDTLPEGLDLSDFPIDYYYRFQGGGGYIE